MSAVQDVYQNFSACCSDFILGVESLKERSIPEAVYQLRKAYENVNRSNLYHNKYASYYGLARVLSGDDEGLDLCRKAAVSEINDGDVYLNLARAEWFCHNRKNTIIALKKGLKVDKRHPGLRQMRSQLGVRQRSTLRFLPRSHPLNHALGKLMRTEREII